jgi:hypothetical protein
MRVVALVEYEMWGDDEYAYVERYEVEYGGRAYSVWRTRFVHDLLARGIVVKSIKELEVSYVRD